MVFAISRLRQAIAADGIRDGAACYVRIRRNLVFVGLATHPSTVEPLHKAEKGPRGEHGMIAAPSVGSLQLGMQADRSFTHHSPCNKSSTREFGFADTVVPRSMQRFDAGAASS